MPRSTPSSSSQPMSAPVFARRFSWRGGVVTGGCVVTGGLVVVVTGGVVVEEVEVVVVEVGGLVVVVVDEVVVEVVVDEVVEDVVEDVVEVPVVVLVVVHGVVVVVDVVVEVESPRGTCRSGRSFGHHALTHTRWSPEAAASGPAPCSATTVSTAPAASTPM